MPNKFAGTTPDGIPFRERLRAWWEGEVPRRPIKQAGRSRASLTDTVGQMLDAVPVATASGPYWTGNRIEVAQRIWGQEHLTPGGDEYVRALVKPLALDPAMSVLDLGAGLGGSTRLMHREFGVWLTGFDGSPELVEAGMALSVRAGLEKKAPVAHFDPRTATLKKGGFDRVLARDLIHLVEDKQSLLREISQSLKKRGQVVFTDFVLRDDGPHAPAVKLWAQGEPVRSQPWTTRTMQRCFEDLKFKVHISEDETDRLRNAIIIGWKQFQSLLDAASLPPELVDDMLAEAERWARCTAALDSGDLRHYRIVASI